MDLIVSHDHADFDALASQIAAQKLYPNAQIAMPRSVGREVHPYLAMHRDRFRLTEAADVRWNEVRRLIFVDIRARSRVRHLEPYLSPLLDGDAKPKIHIFDHHASREDDLHGELEVVEPVGSTVSLLIERLRVSPTALDVIEATLCALGIHTDTGSLTFANSTSRDARALSWLMDEGAQLSVLNRYLHAPFSLGQRRAITQVMQTAVEYAFGGLRIGVAKVDLEEKLNGLDEVTSRALDTLGYHALFGVFNYSKGRTAVIARGRTDHLNLAELLKPLGGGGHGGAASAMVHDQDPDWVEAQILGSLRANPPKACAARDLMSSPVHTVSVDLPLSEVARRLLEWRHTGVCVMQQGQLKGVLSHRDLEKAIKHNRLHLPAASHMSQAPVTCEPDTPLESALSLMEKRNVGRLPVLRAGRLVGILTRSDLLGALYSAAEQ